MAATGKILVTGCQGQLGMDLMSYLGESATVVGIDQHDIDICNYSGLLELFRLIKPQWIIHTAAYTDVDGCEINPGLAMAINADGTENVARAASKVGACLLYYSTDYVFDGESKQPYVESDSPNPKTKYGLSKLAGEERVTAWVTDFVIMRVSWVYGRYGKNFVKTMLRLGREQSEHRTNGNPYQPLKVVNDQVGNPTWTREIANQTKVLLDSGLFGLFHSTAEGETSWYHLAQQIFQLAKIQVEMQPCTTDQFPRPAIRPHFSSLENCRLKEAGLNVMRHYQSPLEEFLNLHGAEL